MSEIFNCLYEKKFMENSKNLGFEEVFGRYIKIKMTISSAKIIIEMPILQKDDNLVIDERKDGFTYINLKNITLFKISESCEKLTIYNYDLINKFYKDYDIKIIKIKNEIYLDSEIIKEFLIFILKFFNIKIKKKGSTHFVRKKVKDFKLSRILNKLL